MKNNKKYRNRQRPFVNIDIKQTLICCISSRILFDFITEITKSVSAMQLVFVLLRIKKVHVVVFVLRVYTVLLLVYVCLIT